MSDTTESGLGSKLKLGALTLIALAAVGWIVVQLTTPDADTPVPVSRSTRDFVVDWECLACKHRFRQNAGPGAQPCPKCGQPQAYAVLPWECPQHGVIRVVFQYDEAGKPTEVRLPGGDWQPAMNEYGGWTLQCPKCAAPLSPVR